MKERRDGGREGERGWEEMKGCKSEIVKEFLWFHSLCPSQQFFSHVGKGLPV